MNAPQMSRREREIIDILYAHEEATAIDVRLAMTGAPSDATVRTLLRILGDKGLIRHRRDGRQFRYRTVRPKKVRESRRFVIYWTSSSAVRLKRHLLLICPTPKPTLTKDSSVVFAD